jgi:hypothetical protein
MNVLSRAWGRLSRVDMIWFPPLFIAVFGVKFLYKTRNGLGFDYDLVLLGNNYFQFGAVRRGLVGSIIYLTGEDLPTAAIYLYFISFLVFLALAYLILSRCGSTATRIPFFIILGAVLLIWSAYIAGFDILVGVLLAIVTMTVIRGKIIAASACLAIGLAVHETTVIYGIPLLLALLLDEGRYKKINHTSAVIGGIIIVAAILLFFSLSLLPHSDSMIITETIKSKIPLKYSSEATDQALFFLLAGVRGLRLAQCVLHHNINYFIHPFVAIIILYLAILSLSGVNNFKWVAPALASAPPMLFLWFITIDMSRWVAFAIFNVWLVCAVRESQAFGYGVRGNWGQVACASAVLVLISPIAHVSMATGVPSPLIEKGVEHFFGSNGFPSFDECDPTWRSVLTEKGSVLNLTPHAKFHGGNALVGIDDPREGVGIVIVEEAIDHGRR